MQTLQRTGFSAYREITLEARAKIPGSTVIAALIGDDYEIQDANRMRLFQGTSTQAREFLKAIPN